MNALVEDTAVVVELTLVLEAAPEDEDELVELLDDRGRLAAGPAPSVRTDPLNKAALWCVTQLELAGMRAVYGIVEMAPRDSGGWVYVWT